jgi:hypothetical protein
MTRANAEAHKTSVGQRRWIAILLMVAAVVVIAPTMFRELKPRDLPGASVLLATTAGIRTEDVDLILDRPIWGEFVGDGEGAVPTEARAVRLGAALADLELRHLRADATAQASAADVIQLLQTFPRSEDAVGAFQSLGAIADAAALRTASQAAERAAHRRLVRLGSWLRSARFAAASADSSVFDLETVRSVSQTAITYDPRPETEFAVRQFERIARQRPHDWTALGTGLEELLRRLGTR